MNILDFDYQNYQSSIIEAFCHVYGEKYRDIISNKIKNTVVFPYYSIKGMKAYIHHLQSCKARSLISLFYQKLGIDNINKSSGRLLLTNDYPELYFTESRYRYNPLLAFDKKNPTPENILQKNKLELINYFLRQNDKQITLEDLSTFIESDEFKDIFQQIKQYRDVYDQVYLEYCEWKKSLAPYEDYIKREKEVRDNIYAKQKETWFFMIYPMLPDEIKDKIQGLGLEKQIEMLLGRKDITQISTLESFSSYHMRYLKNTDINIYRRLLDVVTGQKEYLENMGISFPFSKLSDCNTEEDIKRYLEFLEQDEVKKILPSQELIQFASEERMDLDEETKKDYISQRDDFQKVYEQFLHYPSVLKNALHLIEKNTICIMGEFGYYHNKGLVPYMLYTVMEGNEDV